MRTSVFFQIPVTLCSLVIILLGPGCKKKEINLPIVHTEGVRKATTTTALAGGWITDDGGGEIQDRGVCWSEGPSPTLSDLFSSAGSGIGTFEVTVSGLTSNTLYYLRAYATNEEGTSYGKERLMKTMFGTVTDIEGKVYPTVMIGTQEWMAENLAVTRYRNGEPIANLTGGIAWEETESGAYCWYENDYQGYGQYYGALYNRYAIIDPRNICPVGWHIPTIAEWQVLFDFLGNSHQVATKLKSAVTDEFSHHVSPPYRSSANVNATNESGFSGFGAGWRTPTAGNFQVVSFSAYWWSISLDGEHGQGVWISSDDYMNPQERHRWNSGLSVRCIRD